VAGGGTPGHGALRIGLKRAGSSSNALPSGHCAAAGQEPGKPCPAATARWPAPLGSAILGFDVAGRGEVISGGQGHRHLGRGVES
jgi:hypothetical protein